MNQKNHSPRMYHPTWVGWSLCRTCNILHEVLFSGPSPGEQGHIIRGIDEPIDEFNYEKGAVTCQQGCDDNAVFTIRSGLIKLVRYLPDGRERIICLMKTAVFLSAFKCGFSYQGSIMSYNARGKT